MTKTLVLMILAIIILVAHTHVLFVTIKMHVLLMPVFLIEEDVFSILLFVDLVLLVS
jgi:hypothetical protein